MLLWNSKWMIEMKSRVVTLSMSKLPMIDSRDGIQMISAIITMMEFGILEFIINKSTSLSDLVATLNFIISEDRDSCR